MIVGVSGGRDYDRFQVIHPTLSRFHDRYGIEKLIEGGAKGADFSARSWAYANGVEVKTFNADWDAHGKRAGIIRNEEMALHGGAHLFIIFEGGRGTTHMKNTAVDYGIPTLVIPDHAWKLAKLQAESPFDDVIIDDSDWPRKPYWALAPGPNQRWSPKRTTPAREYEAIF